MDVPTMPGMHQKRLIRNDEKNEDLHSAISASHSLTHKLTNLASYRMWYCCYIIIEQFIVI